MMKRMNRMKTGGAIIHKRKGNTLIWAMIAALILLLIVGIVFAVTSTATHRTVNAQTDTQAYYTARSLNERFVTFLTNTPELTDETLTEPQKLIEHLAVSEGKTIVETYTAEQLGAGLGSGKATLTINDAETEILITTTGYYGDNEETITTKMALVGRTSFTYQDDNFPPQTSASFDLTPYSDEIDKINNAAFYAGNDSLIKVGDTSVSANSGANAADAAAINAPGGLNGDSGSNKEVLWTHKPSSATASDAWYYSETLGTELFPMNGSAGHSPDTRRWMTGVNGRLALNPLETARHVTDNYVSPMTSSTVNTNTKLSTLAIDTSAVGASTPVYLRLDGGVSYQNARLNALMMFDFTSYAGSDTTVNGYTYRPHSYAQLNVIELAGSDLDTNLIFGHFGHKYDCFMDTYHNWGSFADAIHGAVAGEFVSLWPYAADTHDTASTLGIPQFAVDYDKTSFYILDSNASKYVRFMQGTNLINGSIYSNRAAIVGGGLVKSGSIVTYDNINSGVDGFSEAGNTIASYANATLRYDQNIIDSNLIFASPAGGTVNSAIRRPDTWEDRTYGTAGAKDKTFYPQMRITGGTIYVDKGQNLTIQGCVNSTQGAKASLDNMHIAPDQIIVKDGASLTIEGSASYNVDTAIYVEDGGTLNLQNGAKIAGSIYAAGANAKVNINGTVVFKTVAYSLDGTNADSISAWSGAKVALNASANFTGNIFAGADAEVVIGGGVTINGDIYSVGKVTVDGSFTINTLAENLEDNPDTDVDEASPALHGVIICAFPESGAGSLEMAGTPVVSGNSGKIHTLVPFPGVSGAAADKIFCNDRDSSNNICRHWTSSVRVWLKQSAAGGG